MRQYPAPIHKVMAALTKLPGVGPKTALRYCFVLLRQSQHEREVLAKSIIDLQNIGECKICHTFSEREKCEICTDDRRDKTKLCVVSESRDIATIESTNIYHGKYFVLGGTLNPIEGKTPDTLNIDSLISKINNEPELNEIILAFSPDVHGETTIIYLSRKIKEKGIKTTRLARGLPMGADIEYADEVTLGDALLGRREI